MISRSIERLTQAFILLAFVASNAFSQSGNGLISGSVTDPTGARGARCPSNSEIVGGRPGD